MARADAETGGKKLQLTITTPRGVKFQEEADMIVMRTVDGDLGVLPGHEPLMTALGSGILRIVNNGGEKRLAVFEGTASVDADSVQILTTIAQSPDEIDLERAEEDRREAEAALQDAHEEDMTLRLRIMQMRALIRINVHHADSPDDVYVEDEENGQGNTGNTPEAND